jgi:hypothetical protein
MESFGAKMLPEKAIHGGVRLLRILEGERHALDLGGGHEPSDERAHHGGELDFAGDHHLEHPRIGARNAAIIGMDRDVHRAGRLAAHFPPKIDQELMLVALLGLVVKLQRQTTRP